MKYLLTVYSLYFIFGCAGSNNPEKYFIHRNIESIDVSIINYGKKDDKMQNKFHEAVISNLNEKGYYATKGVLSEKDYNIVKAFYNDIKPISKYDASMIININLVFSQSNDFLDAGNHLTGISFMYWLYDNKTREAILRADEFKGTKTIQRDREVIDMKYVKSINSKGEIVENLKTTYRLTESEDIFMERVIKMILENLPPKE